MVVIRGRVPRTILCYARAVHVSPRHSRKRRVGSAASGGDLPMCSSPHSNGSTRRLSVRGPAPVFVAANRSSSGQAHSAQIIAHRRRPFRTAQVSVGGLYERYESGTFRGDGRLRLAAARCGRVSVVIVAGVFLLGLIIGSFLNVCILRIPRAESIVLPASHCPACNTAIKPYDNIPVLSWLMLRGRCRKCKAPISALYPCRGTATGLLFVACYLVFGLTAEALKWAIFAALMVVLTVTDFRERILPDKVNFVGLGLGLLLSLFTKPVDGTALWLSRHLSRFRRRSRCFPSPMP